MAARVLRSSTMAQRLPIRDAQPTGSSDGLAKSGARIAKPGPVAVIRVEEIVGKRINDGVVEYFVYWRGNPNKKYAWEPEEFLNCPNQIAMFEERCKLIVAIRERQSNDSRKRKSSKNIVYKVMTSAPYQRPANAPYQRPGNVTINKPRGIKGPIGFARNLEPEQVLLAIKDQHDTLMLMMKWKGSYEIDYVTAKMANVRCPQLVISYYESIIEFR